MIYFCWICGSETAQQHVQPTGGELGSKAKLTAPAADVRRWSALHRQRFGGS